MHRALALVVSVVLAGTGLIGASSRTAEAAPHSVPRAVNGAKVTTTVLSAISRLKVAAPVASGYSRAQFTTWDDANHNCRDARAEVLAAESTTKVGGGCTITTGRWHAFYDIETSTEASQLDIDHLVPLAEVWRSGARSWTASQREAYANDLSDSRVLDAVSAHVNRSKGDRDPGEWLPLHGRCRYVADWVAVKTRWGLSIDRTEKSALLEQVRGCGNSALTVYRAHVVGSSAVAPSHAVASKPGPKPKPKSKPAPHGTDPRFGTCTEAEAHGYGPYFRGHDVEYGWYEDRDHDGEVCE